MKKGITTTVIFTLLAVLCWGCAPTASYSTASSLRKTAVAADDAANCAERDAAAADDACDIMVSDIQSIKEAEKLFDQKSGIRLSY